MRVFLNNTIVKNLIVCRLITSLICNNIAFAGPTISPEPAVNPDLARRTGIEIHIPESYGKIDRFFIFENKQTDKNVILIKDAHCNYEAQTNISNILDILIRDYKIDLVCVEGAGGYVNPTEIAARCSNTETRKTITDRFLKKGLLTASEALSINKGADPGFIIWGVEDLKLYFKDYQAFRETVNINEETRHFAEILSETIEKLKKKIYSEKLYKFDKEINRYEANEIPLANFIKFLAFTKELSETKYPMLGLVLSSIRLEELIYFGNIESERTEFIKFLEKQLTNSDLKSLVKQTLLFKLGKVPQAQYYAFLKRFYDIYKNDLDFSTENIEKYFELTAIQAQIDENILFRELEEFKNDIYSGLITDTASGKLHELDVNARILNKILILKSTRKEFLYYKNNQNRFKPANLVSFLKVQAPLYNIKLPKELSDPLFLKNIETAILPSEEFYDIALDRDQALVDNLINAMDKHKKDNAILIVGGFHTEGISGLLSKKGICPVTITPVITKPQEDSNEIYLSRMMDKRIDPEMILAKLGTKNLAALLATCKEGIDLGLPDPIRAELGLSEFLPIESAYSYEPITISALREYYAKSIKDKQNINPVYTRFLKDLEDALTKGEVPQRIGIPKQGLQLTTAEETIKKTIAEFRKAINPETYSEDTQRNTTNTLIEFAIGKNEYEAKLAVITLETFVLSPLTPTKTKIDYLIPGLTHITNKTNLIAIKQLADSVTTRIKTSPFVENKVKESFKQPKPEGVVALKAPGAIGLDEDTNFDKSYFEKHEIAGSEKVNNGELEKIFEKAFIEQGAANIPITYVNIKSILKNTVIHTKDTDQLGFQRYRGLFSRKPQDLIYAYSRKEEDGKVHIYVTELFWTRVLSGNALMLAFLLDHEWHENMMNETHKEASGRAWYFLDECGMNPFYRFYLEQLHNAGQEDELIRLLLDQEKHEKGNNLFKNYARKLLQGKRQTGDIGTTKKLLERKWKNPKVLNVYAQDNLGAKNVVNPVVELAKDNDLNIGSYSWKIADEGYNNVMRKIRRALQGENVIITDAEWIMYRKYMTEPETKEAIENIKIILTGVDVVILHDHEFLFLIDIIEESNEAREREGKEKIKIIWHCHLDLDYTDFNVWSKKLWGGEELRDKIEKCDSIILQAREEHENLYSMLGVRTPAVFVPPTAINPADDRHKPLTKEEEIRMHGKIAELNSNVSFSASRPYFLYTGMLDPHKGIDSMINEFLTLCGEFVPGHIKPQLILAVPQNDRNNATHQYIDEIIQKYSKGTTPVPGLSDIHIVFLKQKQDDPDADLIINYLQRKALAGLQFSTREGFGLPVAEMMYKGKPVIGTDTGGIGTQILHGRTGYLIPEKTGALGYMERLITKPSEAKKLGDTAKEISKSKYLTSNLLLNYLCSMYSIIDEQDRTESPIHVADLAEEIKMENIFDTIDQLEQETNQLLENPDINDEDRHQAIAQLMQYAEAIEETAYNTSTENGQASYIVLEKLANIMWNLCRNRNWSEEIDVLCINLPIGAINTETEDLKAGDNLKARFFMEISRYMTEEKKDIAVRYEKQQGGHYGYSKTRMYVAGLGEKDKERIMELYENALAAVGLQKRGVKDFPIFIGHKKISLQGNTRKLKRLMSNRDRLWKSGKKEESITVGNNINSIIENTIIKGLQEALGRAEFIEKHKKGSDDFFMADNDELLKRRAIRNKIAIEGRKKFIPENRYRDGKLPRTEHDRGNIEKIKALIQSKGFNEETVNSYFTELRGYLEQSIRDVRYDNATKRHCILSELKRWKDKEGLKITKAGDEIWFYVKLDNQIRLLCGEMDKFNAFNDAYEPDSTDSIYHQILDWLKDNTLDIYKNFYLKLYDDEKLTEKDLRQFDNLTDCVKQLGLPDINALWQKLEGSERNEYIGRLKQINLLEKVKIIIPDDDLYRKHGHTVHTENAKIKGTAGSKKIRSEKLKTVRAYKTYDLNKLSFHSSDKVRINGKVERLKLYEMKKGNKVYKRFVVHNYRVYTATGKGKKNEEDITDSTISRWNEYTMSPVIATVGLTFTLDRTGLLNPFDLSSQKVITGLNTYQKKHMNNKVQDITEIIADQMINVLEKHKIENITKKEIIQAIIESTSSKADIDFKKLWHLVNRKIKPDRFFEIAMDLGTAINTLLDKKAYSKGSKILATVLREIFKNLPSSKKEMVIKHVKSKRDGKGQTPEKTLFATIRVMAKAKGIEPKSIESIFDLFRDGANVLEILTAYPELDKGQIDASYFDLIEQLANLTGISEGQIRNAFSSELGEEFSNLRESKGVRIENSILSKEVQKLAEYNNNHEDTNLNAIDHNLWQSDFNKGILTGVSEYKRNQYLSALDVVNKDTNELVHALQNSPANQNTQKQLQHAGIILHLEDYITFKNIAEEGTEMKDVQFSYKPGIEALFNNTDSNNTMVFIAPKGLEKAANFALKNSNGFGRNIYVETTPQEASDRLAGLDGKNIVYLSNDSENNKPREEQTRFKLENYINGLKTVVPEKGSALHATLVFAVYYARIGELKENGKIREDVKTLIWHFLKISDYSDEDIRKVLKQLSEDNYFTIKLMRIKDTLREFQNKVLYISTSA